MHVLPSLERPRHGRVTADVGNDPQLELRVVGDDQAMTVGRDETPPYHVISRDLLQVRVPARESPIHRADLKKGGMYPSRHGVGVPGERV